MVNEEIRMRRLSFAKYLVSIGDLNSEECNTLLCNIHTKLS